MINIITHTFLIFIASTSPVSEFTLNSLYSLGNKLVSHINEPSGLKLIPKGLRLLVETSNPNIINQYFSSSDSSNFPNLKAPKFPTISLEMLNS